MWNFCCNYVKLRQLSRNVKMWHFLSQKKGFRKPKKWCALRSEPGPDFNQPWMCFFEEKSAKFGLGVRSNILLPHIGGSHPIPSLSILSRERRSTANYTHTHTHTHTSLEVFQIWESGRLVIVIVSVAAPYLPWSPAYRLTLLDLEPSRQRKRQ